MGSAEGKGVLTPVDSPLTRGEHLAEVPCLDSLEMLYYAEVLGRERFRTWPKSTC
jgi:hypothetical protein